MVVSLVRLAPLLSMPPLLTEEDFAALVEHLLSTPMEAMDYEGVRCGPLLSKDFLAHINAEMRKAAALGPDGDDTMVELQALAAWVMAAREKQAERDDALRRRKVRGGVRCVYYCVFCL
jgi:hypothetical protein